MLDGLDTIDWSAVNHAYGPATDVPDMLRAVAGSDQAARAKALWDLSGSIYHQGTVYPATAQAVPFLARIAREGQVPQGHRAAIVALLGGIAGGSSYLEVHGSLLVGGMSVEEEARLARGMGDVAAARAAVGRETPALVADLGGMGPQIDWRLAALAAQVPEEALSALPLMEGLKERSEDPRLQAALDLTSALISGAATSTVIAAAASSLDPELAGGLGDLGSVPRERRGRLVAAYLYETGFDETGVAG